MAKKSPKKKTKAKAGGTASGKKAAPRKKTAKKASVSAKTTKKKTSKVVKKTTKKAAGKKVAKKKAAGKKVTTKKTSPPASTRNKSSSKKVVTTLADSAAASKKVKSKAPSRYVPPAAAEEPSYDPPALTDAQLRKVKTGLTRKDIQEFRTLLLERRAEILGDVTSMEESRAGGSGGDLSHMPLHMADVGSDAYEQEFTLGLMESERKLLRQIDEALGRIEKKTYGVCVDSGKPIPRARLEIKPWAKYTIEVARERERRGY